MHSSQMAAQLRTPAIMTPQNQRLGADLMGGHWLWDPKMTDTPGSRWRASEAAGYTAASDALMLAEDYFFH